MTTAILILQTVVILCTLWLVKYVVDKGREDRRSLENALLALTNPGAAVAREAIEHPAEGTVKVLDDKAMYDLQRSADQ